MTTAILPSSTYDVFTQMEGDTPDHDSQPALEEDSLATKTRFFAVIIGINEYEHADISNLDCAVADAEAVVEFLTKTMNVDPSGIRILRDHHATREAIIQGLIELRSDERIQRDDPILIFYAGHGSEAPAPIEWKTPGSDDAPIIQIQMILPHNFNLEATSNPEQQGIFDFTLSKLLSQLAQEKGDNITVIFDSCHSGSSTRDEKQPGVMSRGVKLADNYVVMPYVDRDIVGDSREAKVSTDFEKTGLASHVLLAACSQKEIAQESNGHGHFTQALLEYLHDSTSPNCSYLDLIENLRDLGHRQHPQCEGKNRSRILFNGKVVKPRRVLYPVEVTQTPNGEQKITLEGGQAHGITVGAEFDVFMSKEIGARPVCSLVATISKTFTSIMDKVPGGDEMPVPTPAWALLTKLGKDAEIAVGVPAAELELVEALARAVEEIDKGQNSRTRVRLVEYEDEADLKVKTEGDQIGFDIADQISVDSGLTRLPYRVSRNDRTKIQAVLEHAADFFFHLHRSNKDAPIAGRLVLQAFELMNKYNTDEKAWALTPRLDGSAKEQDLVRDNKIELEINPDREIDYGFRLSSEFDRRLYVWVFMFDMCDLCIDTLYQPNAAKSGADASIKKNAPLEIGFGSGGVPPQTFFLPRDLNVDITYLKIFVSTKPIDLAYIAQESPFDGNERNQGSERKRWPSLWDTIVVPIVQRKQAGA